MNRSEGLIKQQLIDKANEAIRNLNQNITDLDIVNNGLFSAVTDTIITGTLGEVIVQHLLDFIYLNSTFKYLLLLDIGDYNELINLLNEFITNEEDEWLNGLTLAEGIEECNASIQQANAEWESYQDFYNSRHWFWQMLGAETYSSTLLNSSAEINEYERQIEEYERKQALFDEIQLATGNLFVQNNDLRLAVQAGYDEIRHNWDGGTCSVDNNAGWRSELDRINNDYIQRYADRYYSYDDDGNMIINWEAVDETLLSDPNDVNPYQYLALNTMYSQMPDSDMNCLFTSHSQICDENGIYIMRPALGVSLEYYSSVSFASVAPDEWEYSNDITRATAMSSAYNFVRDHSITACSVSFQSNVYHNVEGDRIESYNIDIFCPPCYAEDPGVSVSFTTCRYTFGSGFDFATSGVTYVYIDDLGGSWSEFTQEEIGSLFLDKVQDTVDEVVDGSISIFLVPQLIYDSLEQRDARCTANAIIDAESCGKIFESVSAGGILISSDYCMFDLGNEDSVAITNINIDEAALTEDVELYNSRHPGAEISVRDVENGFYRAITGELEQNWLDITQLDSDDPFVLFYGDYWANSTLYNSN